MPNYDVFLSHNSQDKPAVEQIARALRDEHGLKCWLDKWNLVPGEPWEEAIEDALDDCQTYGVFLGPSGIGPWENEEFRSALDTRVRDKKRRVIPVLLPGAPDNHKLKLPRFLQRLTWVDFRRGLDDEDALYRLVCGIKGIAPGDISKNDKKTPSENELPVPGILPAGSRMYFGHNPNFTGREADLRALAKALVFDPQPGALTVTQTLAGMGGIGKTQLAVEFCYRYGRFFNGVHWIDARGELEGEIAACGTEMDLPEWPPTTPEQVKMTLWAWQATPKRLLVLDNLEDPQTLREWKHAFEGLRILVTSRNQNWDTDLAHLYPIGILARSESLALLHKLAPRLKDLPNNDVTLVAERLGDLPLALDLAGRYLYYHSLTPLDYLDRISKTALKHRSLKSNNIGSPTRHDTDVELTFVLSWEQLGNDDVDVLAKRFFIASGYLAPNVPIPHDIFYWLSHTNDREIYQEKTDDALLRLRQLGLLTDTLSLHPLLAEFARAKVIDLAVLTDISDQMSRLSKNALATGVPSDFYPLRPHIEVLAFHAERAELLEAGMLWNNLGYHYWMIPEYEKARVAHECALAIWEKQLGREHPQLATVINNLGLVLKDMGDLPSAKACFERAMMIWEKQFGRDHPNVASCANNLGSVLQALGDLLGAKNMLERALAIDEKIYGKEHPEIAMDVNNLGRVLRAMGDLLGAKTMYERALAINEKIYGKEYPDVSIDVNNLGMVLVDLGDLVGARIMYERGLAIDKKTYGNEHPEVAADFHNLAVVLVKMGDLPQALELEQHALAMFQKFLPAEHQDIENSRKWLAEIERRLKDGNR